MLRNLQRLLISLAAVVAAWWLYAVTIVPWIDPQVRRREEFDPTADDIAAQRSLTQTTFRAQLLQIFPEGSWELGEPNVLETDQGVFLFREYHELPDHRFEIKPCTLVAFSKPKSGEGDEASDLGRVIVLQAPEGAQLQFDDDSDLARFRFGKLLGGRLPGEIHIWSHEPNGGQPFEFTTRNIQIEERRIWTPHDVKFKFGASRGSGRDLEIHLQRTVTPTEDGAAAGTGTAVGSALGNIQSVELVHLDELHLEGLDSASTDNLTPADSRAPTASRAPTDSFGDGPLDIRCRGPVRLNVVDLVATLEDSVTVTRLVPGSPADQLSCDTLTVVLRQPLPPAAVEGEPPPKQQRFELERLIATGQLVEFNAPSQRASARGQRLEVNVPARRLRLDGANGATLVHESAEISAVNLEYELGAATGDVGRAWAQGPGRMKVQLSTSPSAADTCEATWGGELQIRPHEGLHVVSLTGGSTVEYAGSGRFAAESLHMWLRPVRTVAKSARPTFVPDRLLAQGDVSINAQQLLARTQRVEAWFRDSDEPAIAASPRGQPGRLASSGDSSGKGLAFGSSSPDGARFEVNGDLVRVALLRAAGGTVGLETIEVTGQVLIRELAAQSPGTKPLEIRGDRLRLEQSATGLGTLRVIGQPATVAARGMTLIGSEVQLDQAANKLRIPGEGEMTLPPFDLKTKPRAGVIYENPAAMNAAASASLGRPTTITWKNGLEFDGQSATFNRDVQVRASQRLTSGEWLDLVLIGGDLEVRLAARVLFADSNGEAPQTSVEYLKFGGSVYLDGRTHQGDQLTSYERLQLRNLVLHQGTGKLTGEGPGWLAGARLDDGAFTAPPTAGPPPAPPIAPRILFLHIAFQQGIEGHLLDRQVEFVERVRAVFGPVPNWDSEIDPNRPDEWPLDAVELRCDRLSVAQQGGATPDTVAADLNATGNATVEGKKFGARAARISYSQAKELLVLAGDGRSGAEFWKKPRSQAKPDASANTIMYWRRENRVSVNGVKYVDLNSLAP